MTTLDAVRSAAQAHQPWSRLDELVRAELASGRRVKEVADDFIRLRDDVWGTPGLSEDAADAYGDTLDALTGNCARASCYIDPPAAAATPATVSVTASGSVATAASGRLDRKRKRAPLAAKSDSKTASAIAKRLARDLKRLQTVTLSIRPETPDRMSLAPGRPHHATGTPPIAPPGGATHRVIFPAGEKRGVQLLGDRAVRQMTKGLYFVSYNDLATLAGANIPFVYVGIADG